MLVSYHSLSHSAETLSHTVCVWCSFVSLETACADYLHVQAQTMTGDSLICLAKLADHLGLSSLLETAAEALIKLPWEGKMSRR